MKKSSMKKSKKIIVSVTNDLVTDQRVNRVCTALVKHGGNVLLVGRRKKDSLEIPDRPYKTHRMKLWFEKGALFYANYNLRLFFFLLFHKADILVSNDLDTLLPNYLVSKLKGIHLVYDSHEYYTGVPELQNRKLVKGIWHNIERFILPKLKHIYTVNDSIAKLYEDEYKVKLSVVRNIPVYNPVSIDETMDLKLPKGKKIILYQGAGINVDRGVEEVVEAMQYIENALLLIVGSGDVISLLKQHVIDLKLNEKVIFIAKVPFEQLKQYTLRADIGLTGKDYKGL
jgi:glycosyltransferase involved in cell wall biosynthesis